MAIPTQDLNHVVEARTLIIEQFKNTKYITGFLDAYSRRVQELEGVFFDILDSRILDNATGDQLDKLGDLVGEERLGRDDDQYKPAIRIRIRVNKSQGRSKDILDVAVLCANPAERIGYLEYMYSNFDVELYGIEGEQYIASLLNLTRMATSYGQLVTSDLDRSALLQLDDAANPDSSIMTVTDAVSNTGLLSPAAYGLPPDYTGVSLIVNDGLVVEDDWYVGDSTIVGGDSPAAFVESPLPQGVSPATATHVGGTTVHLTGTGLGAAQAVVLFDGTNCLDVASFVVVSETDIDLVTPAHAAHVVDIIVVNPAAIGVLSGALTFT